MYHIGNDKRILNSAEQIYLGLEACMKKKNFDQITFSDISKASYVSRSTIYRIFDVPQDIIQFKCDQIYQEMDEYVANTPEFSVEEVSIRFLEVWMQHASFFEILVKTKNTSFIVDKHFKNMHQITSNLRLGEHKDPTYPEFMSAVLVLSAIGVLEVWLRNGKKETSEELFEYLIEFGNIGRSIQAARADR